MLKLLALLATLTFAAEPLTAQAKCGFGQPPSYDDISAVMLKQDGCGGTLHPPSVGSLNCSAFWVLFWSGEPTEYSQYNLQGQIGFYYLPKTVRDIQGILQQDNFFLLSPPDAEVTDTAESVLSVKRCGVITRIRIYNRPGSVISDTAKLFADITRFVSEAPRTKASSQPKDFEYTLLFDP